MKKVPLLPNLVTTGNLFCGFLSIVNSLQGDFLQAAWLILAAMVFDFFDGQIARLQKCSSDFGLQYDSLCDVVSFGLAPAFLGYRAFFFGMGRIGIAVSFLYLACTALRLARFNVSCVHGEKKAFLGLPCPAAAGMLITTIILEREIPEIYPEVTLAKFLPCLFVLVALLMVSNLRYPTVKSINTLSGKPFFHLALIVSGGVLIVFHLEVFLFLIFLGYVLSGMWQEVRIQHQKKKVEVDIQNRF